MGSLVIFEKFRHPHGQVVLATDSNEQELKHVLGRLQQFDDKNISTLGTTDMAGMYFSKGCLEGLYKVADRNHKLIILKLSECSRASISNSPTKWF